MILLVEDEPGILNLVSVNLLRRGYEVAEAANGAEALELLEDTKPELIILDLRLPEVSGWAVLEHLSGRPSSPTNLPVVVMTASVIDPDLVRSQYPCVTEVLTKPFDISTLISTVRNVLAEK